MLPLYSMTLALSAGLVFLIQPMFAKFVLPSFGSTPAVWNTSLVFFQTALLLAYLYAHASTRRLGVRRQAALHLVLVVLAAVALPIVAPDDFRPGEAPVLSLLGLLALSVGLPFFIVSSTAPLLQRWLSSTDHPAARDPYFLYRASNLGSVIGLLGYPLAMEPRLRLAVQGEAWSVGYGLLVLLLAASAVVLWRSAPAPTAPEPEEEREEPVTPRRRLRWVGLAFVPSGLMLGVTAFLTIDLAPVPLLWALPLSIYLLSFVVAFSATERARRVHRAMVLVLPWVAILLSILLLVHAREPLWIVMPIHLLAFGVVALVCHGELARDRPAASELTGFYLLVSVGGALGGVVTGILVPAVFESVPEYPLAIVAACLCLPKRPPRVPPSRYVRWLDFGLPAAVGVVVGLVLALVSLGAEDLEGAGKSFAFGLGAGIALNFVRRPLRFGLALGAIVAAGSLPIGEEGTELRQDRSFFGVIRVERSDDGKVHELIHGTTTHGAQLQDPAGRRTPLTYFHPTGPIGQVMSAVSGPRTRRVGVIGLGTGSLGCYSRPGDRWTFYELDPTVERIARDPRLFTYLRDCDGRLEVVRGDARLSLEQARPREYGLLVADAFSSDAIPTHLLTREALALYRRKLRPDGVLAFHISNRFLNLEPVLGELAGREGLTCLAQDEAPQIRPPRGKHPSHWVVMAAPGTDLGQLVIDPRWKPCRRTPGNAAWSDDFSSPVSLIDLG